MAAKNQTPEAIRASVEAWLRRRIDEDRWMSDACHHNAQFAAAFTKDELCEMCSGVCMSREKLEPLLERFDVPSPPKEFAE